MTVWLVTSLHRSGSSMMMRCLEAGGMHAVYGHEQDFLNVLCGRDGYQPNPGGFYALDDAMEFSRPDFAAEYDGCLAKIPAWSALSLAPGDYRILFMRRDQGEILASMAEFTPFSVFALEGAVWFYDLVAPALVRALEAHGATVDVVDYGAVVKDPATVLSELAKAGWPIEATKAAAVVDPAQYRSVAS